MRTFRNPLWLLVVTGLAIVGGVVALAMNLQEQPRASLQIDGVAVHSAVDGSDKLSVTGQGLHEDLRAMLLPEPSPGSLENSRLDLPIMLYQLVTDGRLAVANTRSQRLLTLDVTADRRPTVLGEIKLSADSFPAQTRSVSALALVGSKVLVGRSNDGLLLIDVADPTAPRQVDRLEIPDNFHDMESAHGVVYVANREGGLLVVTIEGDRIRSRQVAGSPKAGRVAAHGRRLVVTSLKGDLTFYDLDSQGWPHPVGSLALSQDVRDLELSAEALFVITAKGQLLEFALDRWPRPSLAGQHDLKGRPFRLEAATEAKLLFCSMVGSGLAVIDISRPGAPTVVERVAMAKTLTSMQAHGNRLIMASIDGLRVLSVGLSALTPEVPEVFQPIAEEVGGVRLVKWRGGVYAYSFKSLARLPALPVTASPVVVANGEAPPFLALPGQNEVRLHAIHGMSETVAVDRIPVNDPDAAGFADYEGVVRDAGWYAGRLYVLTSNRLHIFRRDAGGIVIPEQEYPLTGNTVKMAWLASGFIVVANRHEGLQVIDVRNPGEPRLVGEYPLPKHHRTIGAFNDMLVDGHRLIITRARLGVDIYDLSNPSAPRLLQRIDTPGSANQLSLENGLLIVGDMEKGVFVIDMDGSYGVPVGGYPLTVSVSDLLACGDRLLAANPSGGVVSLPAPQRLVAAGATSGSEMAWAVPADIPAGYYSLRLYDNEGESAGFPVVLQ